MELKGHKSTTDGNPKITKTPAISLANAQVCGELTMYRKALFAAWRHPAHVARQHELRCESGRGQLCAQLGEREAVVGEGLVVLAGEKGCPGVKC